MTHRLRVSVSRLVLCFLEIHLDPNFLHPLVRRKPTFVKVRVEVRLVTGEFAALKAEIYSLLFVAGRDAAMRILAVALAASLTIPLAELIQQLFECGIVFEHRQKVGKPLRIAVEWSEQPF